LHHAAVQVSGLGAS